MRTDITPTLRGHQTTLWQSVVLLMLAFWLGASLLLDLVIMPGLNAAGMTSQPGFAIAGHLIFSNFNHIELIIAAVVLTGLLVLARVAPANPGGRWSYTLPLAIALLVIPLVYNYILTPEMSASSIQLSLFESGGAVACPANSWHQIYWGLEVIKLGLGGALLAQLCRHPIADDG